jgi:hypothetical protein
MFNIYLAIYIIVSIGLIAGGTMKLYNLDQTAGAVIFCIGVVIICIIYGLRWFGADNSLFSQTPVPWPPTINSCPDYLTYYVRKMPDSSVKNTCIDFIGVSTNGSLKVFPKDATSPPTTDDYYFSIDTTVTNPEAKNMELCQKAIMMGLSWEGITNGESCVTAAGLVAPTTPGAGGSGCPK